jgi:16S rRNA processing protein RimM
MSPENRIELGRVVGAHGLQGQIRVHFFGDSPENLINSEVLWLADHRDDLDARCFEVQFGGTGRAKEARIGLKGIVDRDLAEGLRGLIVMGEASRLEDLAEGEYYWFELVGCRVATEDDRNVGTVREIWETGAHDVLVVEDEAGHRNLIPTAREIMREVDLDAKQIKVASLPGLIDLGEGADSETAVEDEAGEARNEDG